MEFPQKEITLKNGKTAILRSPVPEDAKALVDLMGKLALETPFILRSPEDPPPTVEVESAWIQNSLQSESSVSILCEADGLLVGICTISYTPKVKIRHRGQIGVSVLKSHWGNHIASILFEEMLSIGKAWGLTQLELAFIEGNDRARGLYEKMGFRIFGEIPNAVRQADGTFCKEIQMVRALDEREGTGGNPASVPEVLPARHAEKKE